MIRNLFTPSIWLITLIVAGVSSAFAQGRTTYNFNSDWKFIRQDVTGADAVAFDDSKWDTVSTPHSFNDVDSFRTIISHGGGDKGTYKGLAWYRKTFKLPADAAGQKVIIEFEGMRQAGDIFLNGKEVGLYENGITGYGIDITNSAHFGDQANVLAVKVDNTTGYKEKATQTAFEWNANDFNPDHGGINRRVWLHITGKIFQTLPLYYGLGTTGTYIYGQNFNIPAKTCDIGVESQISNESGATANVVLSAKVVDKTGLVCAQIDGTATNIAAGAKADLKVSGPLVAARFWSPDDPYLYDVITTLTVDGKIVDSVKTTTGFRKTEFKGGAGTGGVWINDKFVYLKGYSQRSSDEWAGIGAGYPDWMHDWSAHLLRESNGNYMRWMHVSPQKIDVDAYDRAGIVQVCPAGDKERLVTGVQWDQRAAVMRASMIYFRNSPGILFWEAGNTIVTPDEMNQIVSLRKQYDPYGGRVAGTRDNDVVDANAALTPMSEYFGVMIGQDARTDQLKSPTELFRGYSAERRDKAPIIETEDFRDEGARRFWDDVSPPYFGFKKGQNDTYAYTSETFALAQAKRYWAYWTNRISNPDPAHSKWSGYASIYFIDSDADGRQDTSEVCRVSGKVDGMRLPKEIFYTERVMQNESPDIHILGHWTYPASTTKSIFVIANNIDAVELFVNGVSKGKQTQPRQGDGYVYEFTNIVFAPGSIKAVGYKNGQSVAEHELKTAGDPKSIKLTVHTSPDGLHADGEDAAIIDFEVVDANGMRCPTDDARVDFAIDGPGIWRGGYNSGKTDSTNNLYLNTECGINRVAVRSTLKPGTITIAAKRDGLTPATVTIDAKEVSIHDGLTDWMPPRLPGLAK